MERITESMLNKRIDVLNALINNSNKYVFEPVFQMFNINLVTKYTPKYCIARTLFTGSKRECWYYLKGVMDYFDHMKIVA